MNTECVVLHTGPNQSQTVFGPFPSLEAAQAFLLFHAQEGVGLLRGKLTVLPMMPPAVNAHAA